jgi:UPF0148 protein
MADLLKQGAALTEHACPACSSPLFKLRTGDLWCANCQKRVIMLREGESEPKEQDSQIFSSLETTLTRKIKEIEEQIKKESDIKKLKNLGETLSSLLENLDKIKNSKK